MILPDPPGPDALGDGGRPRSTEVTAVKTVCQVAASPYAVRDRLRRAYTDRVGGPGLALADLRTAVDFPVDLALARVRRVDSLGRLLGRGFVGSRLHVDWCRRLDEDPDWGPAGHRGLVFRWTGWGLCVVHDADWLEVAADAACCVLSGKLHDGAAIFVHELTILAKNSGWRELL